MSNSRLRYLWIAFFSLATTSCMMKRSEYPLPPIQLPTTLKEASSAQQINATPLEQKYALWWRIFEHPPLEHLIERALAHNLDLKIASARVAQIMARTDQAKADRLPTLSLPFEARTESPAGGIGSTVPGESPSTQHQYQLSLRADWRVDIWGEKQAGFESSVQQVFRNTLQYDDTRRTLVNQIVQRYIEVLSLNSRIQLADRSEKALQNLLAATETRFAQGDATRIELAQQRSAVAAIRATFPELHRQRDEALNQLAFLAGTTPSQLKLSPSEGLEVLRPFEPLPIVPSRMVFQRPDVQVVEARLRAADADIDVARAKILPPLDLSAQIGYGSLVMSQLFLSHTLFWNTVVGLSATLFDGGKRSREIDYAKAVHEEMVQTYIRVLYNAVREVEDGLSAWKNHAERQKLQKLAAESAQTAWHDLEESSKSGEVDQLTVLDSERNYYKTEEERIQIQREHLKSMATLLTSVWSGQIKTAALPSPAPLDAQKTPWLVQLSGLYEPSALIHLKADLERRFPEWMHNHSIERRLPENHQPLEKGEGVIYHAFIQPFSVEQEAHRFCQKLQTHAIQCTVIPVHKANQLAY